MANAIEVSDSLSNREEQIEAAAKIIGRGVRREVFSAIYYHKAKVKTVEQIRKRTSLSRMRVLQEGRHLASKGIVRQVPKTKGGDTSYEKIDFFHAHKREILNLIDNPRKLAKIPTKRKIAIRLPRFVRIPSFDAKVHRISIDDVDTFEKVKKHKVGGTLPSGMSEDGFKKGVQNIIGEPGEFKDWGGETSDFYTTRLRVKSKRLAAAFAFKGPGERRKLVPGRMGKNGDQAQRLFQEDAEIFFVQHWREIDPSVIALMRSLAVAKAVSTGKLIRYGVIDGEDSERLRLAYSEKFGISKRARKRAKKGR